MKMKQNLTTNGQNTSVKVHAIVSNGITVEAFNNVYFLPYTTNPWFKNASVSDVFDIKPVGNIGIRWEALDVDLEIDCLKHPEKYPLIMKRYAGEVL